jgi:hypothetical protein
MLLKQTKPTQCGRFRLWLTTALSTKPEGDQTRAWINAPAMKLI